MRGISVYITKETAISIIINTMLSVVFVFVSFHGMERIPLWGHGGLLRDAIPQSLAIAFMGSLIPAWITLRRSRITGLPVPATIRRVRPRNVVLRSVLTAAAAGIVGVSLWGILLTHLPTALQFSDVLVLKASYGAVEASVVTPIALLLALHDAAERQR